MSFLFEYQINYYSDSDNFTKLPFAVSALTQEGIEHKRLSIGNQDSGSIYIGKNLLIGAVADGCTSGSNLNGKSYNQVGANIGAYLTVRILRKLVLKRRVPLDEIVPVFERDLLLHYKRMLNVLNPWKFEKEDVLGNMFMSTIIFYLITEKEYLVVHCGDGDMYINGIEFDLNSYSGKYFASNLAGLPKLEMRKHRIKQDLKFQIASQGDVNRLGSILISTDGFIDTDIKNRPEFEDFFFSDNSGPARNGFVDRRTEFRRDVLPQIMERKKGRIWPHDDATFISIKRVQVNMN